MNKSPLSFIAVAFISGIVLAKYIEIPFIFLWIPALISLLLSLKLLNTGKMFLFLVAISVFFLGGAVLRNNEIIHPQHIAKHTPYKGKKVIIEGIVDSAPEAGKRFTSFILNAENLYNADSGPTGYGISVNGKVLVKMFKQQDIFYGDDLRIEGSLYKVPRFRISRNLDYRSYLGQKKIYSILSVGKDLKVCTLKTGGGSRFKGFCYRVRGRMKKIINANMPSFASGILNAIILGERNRLPGSARDLLVNSGTVHIIAISGLHVGLVSMIAAMALMVLRISGRPRYAIIAILLVVYCVMTGARIPVVRVTLIALIVLFGRMINRRTDPYNTLSIVAIAILAVNPYQLFTLSFQLSFISILSIIVLSPRIKHVLHLGKVKGKRTRIFLELFSVSLAVWIGLLPLIAYYFNLVSPISILANIIVVPYLSLIVAGGFLASVVGIMFYRIAYIFFTTCELLIALLMKFISILIRIPYSHFSVPDISVASLVSYYLLIAAFIVSIDMSSPDGEMLTNDKI